MSAGVIVAVDVGLGVGEGGCVKEGEGVRVGVRVPSARSQAGKIKSRATHSSRAVINRIVFL